MFDVFQIGRRMHYAVPSILERSGRLRGFYTDVVLPQKIAMFASKIPGIKKNNAFRRLMSRAPNDIPNNKIVSFPWLGLSFAGVNAIAQSQAASQKSKKWMVKSFGKAAVKKWDRQCDSVYAFNQGALEIFSAARSSGINTFYEQMILPRRLLSEILANERVKWHDWENWDATYDDYFIAREVKEWGAATNIICPSEFVKQGLINEGVSEGRISLVPYGFSSEIRQRNDWFATEKKSSKIKVLFVGAVGLRKGIQYLYEAATLLNTKAIEFDVIGKPQLSKRAMAEVSSVLNIRGLMPAAQVLEEMRKADIFVFPTMCEGSATVIYEALACGLPVVTTKNAGSVITNEVDGLIAEAGDSKALARAIERLIEDAKFRQKLCASARKTALEYSVEKYGDRLISVM